ncbi:urokinase plasminogen activator surface receptor-like isoform X1 [Rhineura floridana]|uniref:urokinase plasminogen activator surface receptor-like isoform X1 n=1 Tax=Rhineura floridana TaxID=261503 RepID=UPI002AC860FA|nr:urokinase plasminogen activator surface receptor-like isoform X1 [Rhineura floridana]XP_061453162.1 urokinase plasminogen activator surface receptor-like isoform X1 [Rhineura floridana]XP_061453163.1 urokinase plasminogen activator surface receptor-like isoform X1 [Rhineura floridana]XP_061453164.1 urokinase plasminogen activator surface receptor-like isoform X1 [Rhineura floridana]
MAAWEKCQHGIKAPLVIAMYFFSMLVAANSLRCYQCVGMFHECVQAEQLCTPRDRSCFASTIKLFYKNNYTEVFMLPDLEIAEYVMKGCSGEGVSNRTANVYSEDDQEVHNAYYCDSDLCNIRFTGAPASSPQVANGMECYSCFDRGTGECAPGNATRIKCLGDMNQCMDFTVINGAWKMTYRTCALETLCRRQYVLPDLSGRLDISCCSTPLCNDGRPGLKSLCSHFSEQGIKRKPENGLECASCCDSGLGECAPGNWTHVKCVGDQNMCVNVTEGGQTLLRSCSLEKLCRERPQLLGLGKNASIRCCSGSLCNHSMTPAAGTARMHLLLPAVLMMMWLL